MSLMEQRYQRAEQLLSWNLTPKLKNMDIRPYWLDEYRFWFQREVKFGREYVLVNCDSLTESIIDKNPLFDNLGAIKSEVKSAVSPDGRWEVISRDDNLFLRDNVLEGEIVLTEDGQPHYGYGTYPDFVNLGIYEGAPVTPAVIWSPDGRYLAVQRVDERQVQDMPLLQFVPSEGDFRPRYHSFKMALPGDTHVPLASLCIIKLETREIIQNDRPPSISGLMESGAVQWGDDNRIYFVELTRDRRTLRFISVDPTDGTSCVLIEEKGQGNLYPGPFPFGPPMVKVIAKTNEFIWYSQCSGWGHLYLHDLATGELKNSITSGEYVVTQIHKFDLETGRLYFTACGREQGRNPYHSHFYRVNLDGGDLVLLTPEDAQHDVIPPSLARPIAHPDSNVHGVSPKAKVFIDTISRVDQPSRSVLRSTIDGTELMTLMQCDESTLLDSFYTPPLSFTVKAADGITDLWGAMYRPSDFDATQCYPVVLCIYGTPHECITPIRFGQTSDRVRDVYRTLAELGFITVLLDPRGTPLRSKAFHDEAYGNLKNGGGIDDQVAALKQLGERHPWMDLDRVGIIGHSGGGFASARAMFSHPDFFKVAVSSAGNHDQRLYLSSWGETFQGLVDGKNYTEQAGVHLAHNLKGKLLLIHGDVDANVHIAHTLQLVDALIEDNKDFDLLVLPNRGHQYAQDAYFIRRVWDYFVQHLLKQMPPKGYRIVSP